MTQVRLFFVGAMCYFALICDIIRVFKFRRNAVPWVVLVIAGLFEMFWALGLKASDGFARFWPSVFTVVTLVLSLYLLSLSLRNIPISTAYVVWTGIGATGTAIAGILIYNEPVSLAKIGCLLLIISGVAGLRVFS